MMGSNGNVGRARELARIRREAVARAIASGVDHTDRRAFSEWREAERAEFYATLCSGRSRRIEIESLPTC